MALPGQNLLVEKPDTLPDSRTIATRAGMTPKNSVWMNGGFWQHVYCASCGVQGGLVPEENMTYAFWLCNDVPGQHGCFRKYGYLTALMVMPDEIFWEEVKAEQIEKYGRLLSNEEVTEVVARDSSPLATLIKEGRSRSTGG